MIYGIPLLRNRVAPRSTIADSILLIRVTHNRITSKKCFPIEEKSWIDLLKIFNDNKVDILICGGVNSEQKKLSLDYGISIIDNVVCSDEEIIKAIENKTLRPGFGFSTMLNQSIAAPNEEDDDIDSGFLHNSAGFLK